MTIKRPLISVVLASYNHADYVEEAIRSVLQQTITNIEIIIVDDGSTDGSDKVIEKIKDNRIKFIKLKRNRAYHPRNLGLSLARGKYIAFQNSDDIWQKDKLEKQITRLLTNKKYSACFTGVEIISRGGRNLNKSWANGLFTTENRTSEKLLRHFFDVGNCLCISSAMIRKSSLKKVGTFDESLVQLSDFDLWIRLAMIGELSILDEKLTKMRVIKEKNISAPSPAVFRRNALELAKVLERYTKQDGLSKIGGIFPDVIPKNEQSNVIKLAHLAQYAWKMPPSHRLFASRIFADLISDTSRRNKITSHFGPEIYLDFIKKQSEIGLSVHE